MFTRMSKGVLWVLVAAIVIGGFVGMAEEVGIGLLIWLGGTCPDLGTWRIC